MSPMCGVAKGGAHFPWAFRPGGQKELLVLVILAALVLTYWVRTRYFEEKES